LTLFGAIASVWSLVVVRTNRMTSPRLALRAELSSLTQSSAAFIPTTGSPHDRPVYG
jgi:hypothetical protein